MARTTKAYRAGYEAGQDAAGWWTQENGGGRDTRGPKETAEWARETLAKIEDCDPSIMDSFAMPSLSGEWADGPSIEDVANLYARRPSPEALDDLCNDWLDGVSEGYMAEVCAHLRSLARES